MDNRNLPDEELHDLLKELGDLQEKLNLLLTKIYTHIELDIIHHNTIKRMIDNDVNK